MIKEAIKYLNSLTINPSERFVEITDIDGIDRMFIVDEDGLGHEVKAINNRAEQALEINTLSGLIDYIKSDLERSEMKLFLHVKNERIVELKSTLSSDGGRELLVEAKAILPRFDFKYFHDTEELIIALQSNFVPSKDRDLLLKVIGNVREENVRNTGDDGMSQAVTIKTGIASADDVRVPNPVTLAPYRTFLEVEQPLSDFIFRMKDGPKGAIFEADGGTWRNKAILNVREYLKKELAEEIKNKKITIIA